MNEKAIFEIGNIIHVRYKPSWNPKKWIIPDKLTAKEIMESFEYKKFKEQNPEICRAVEEYE